MKKEIPTKMTFDLNKLIESFCAKYATLITFLSPTEIELMFQNAITQLNETPDINPDFHINFLVERTFFQKARDEINAGNIDLEILIVDKYLSTAQFMLRQLKYKGEDSANIAEEAIIECIENYDGKEGFKNSILKAIKRILNPPKKEEFVPNIVEPEIVDSSIVQVVSQVKIADIPKIELEESSPMIQTSEQSDNHELVVPNDGIVRAPNQLELLLRGIDILHQVPLEDDKYLKFISLKYGYYNNQYFGLAEIAQILSISMEDVKKYYFQSLEYIKNWFGLQLDNMFNYYVQGK